MQKHYRAYWDQSNPPPLDDPLAETRADLLWSYVTKSDVPTGHFLDAGCGAGWLTASATRRGFDAIGIDIAGNAIALAAQTYPSSTFIEHSLEELPWPVPCDSVDLAASFEVIEHLLNPDALIAGMSATLRPGGYAAITTPYHGRLKNIAVSLTNFDRHFSVTGDHIRFFTDKALSNLLETHGLKVEGISHFGRCYGLWAGVFVWARKA